MASEHVIHANSGNFATEVLGSSIPVLVDFWAEWCGPCKMIAPMLDEVANENVGKFKVAKINIDHEQQLGATYNIRSIPTLLLFKDGQVKEQVVGVISKRDLLAKISLHT